MSNNHEDYDPHDLKKLSGSGVTVGGKTLEEYIDEEAKKEKQMEADEIFKEGESKNLHYHKSHTPPVPEKKQRRGKVRRWSQSEINQRERSKLMNQVESTMEAVMVKLISSDDHLSIHELTEFTQQARKKPEINASSVASTMTNLKRSEVGFFIDGDNDPDSKGMLYWLVPEARNMTFDQIRAVYRKNQPEGLQNVLKSIPALEKYVARGNRWLDHDSRSPSLKKASEARSKTKESNEDPVVSSEVPVVSNKDTAEVVNAAIEGAIKSALGVDVTVNGKIDIVFSFKLG